MSEYTGEDLTGALAHARRKAEDENSAFADAMMAAGVQMEIKTVDPNDGFSETRARANATAFRRVLLRSSGFQGI